MSLYLIQPHIYHILFIIGRCEWFQIQRVVNQLHFLPKKMCMVIWSSVKPEYEYWGHFFSLHMWTTTRRCIKRTKNWCVNKLGFCVFFLFTVYAYSFMQMTVTIMVNKQLMRANTNQVSHAGIKIKMPFCINDQSICLICSMCRWAGVHLPKLSLQDEP